MFSPLTEYVDRLDRAEALMEARVAEILASAKDDLEEETRNEIMAMRKQHIEEMGEMRKRDEQFFEVSHVAFLDLALSVSHSFFLFFSPSCHSLNRPSLATHRARDRI